MPKFMRWICCCLFGVLVGSGSIPAAFAQGPAAYSVEAIRYGTLVNFPVDELVEGAAKGRTLDIAMVVWLVRGHGRTILVDSGFYRPSEYSKLFTYRELVKPSEAIRRTGAKPEDITDIIVTHMHWDHAGGLDLFANARVWLQHAEYSYYTGEAWQSPTTHGGIDPNDAVMLVRLNTEGRVRWVEGDDQQIFPGIRCYTGGKHTFASQYVSVSTGSSIIVLASDNVYLYENLRKHVPIAETLDPTSNLQAQDRMRTIASEERLIVPGHDPQQFTLFHSVAPGVVEIK